MVTESTAPDERESTDAAVSVTGLLNIIPNPGESLEEAACRELVEEGSMERIKQFLENGAFEVEPLPSDDD